MHSGDTGFCSMAMIIMLLTIACSPQVKRPSSVVEGWRAMQPILAKMVLSFFDTGLEEEIGGHGESTTPRRMRALPRESAYLALEYAIDAVKDGIEMKRAAFSR